MYPTVSHGYLAVKKKRTSEKLREQKGKQGKKETKIEEDQEKTKRCVSEIVALITI